MKRSKRIPVTLEISKLFDEIDDLLSGNHPQTNSPITGLGQLDLELLRVPYENELRNVAHQIWTNLNEGALQRTSTIRLTLSADQLKELNANGEVTLNLIEEGFINPARQDIKLLQMGVAEVESLVTSVDEVQAANVQFRFEHAGSSIIQSEGTKYAFQHITGENDDAFFWSTDYDANGSGELIQSKVSPSAIAAVEAVLDVDGGSLTSPYAHPGAWSDITIHTEIGVKPTTVNVEFQELTLFVEFDSDLPETETALLDVRMPERNLTSRIG